MASAFVKNYLATISRDELVYLYRGMQGTTVVSLLADKDSPFRHIAPLLINNLRIVENDKIIIDFHNSTLVVGLQAPISIARDVLQSCGKVFKHISFRNLLRLSDMYQHFALLFAAYLTPQISLEIEFCRFHLVDVFTRKLKERGIEFISINFRLGQRGKLQGLNYIFAAEIKVLHFTGIEMMPLNSKWAIIGQSLEEVNLVIGSEYGYNNGAKGWKKCIAEMKIHARNLSSISLKYPLVPGGDLDEAQLTDFFTSYGEQLLNLDIGNMSVESCTRIVDSCPNVEVSFRNKPNVFAAIPALALKLRELSLSSFNFHRFGDMAEAFVGFNALNVVDPNIDEDDDNDDDDAFNSQHEASLREAMGWCCGLEKLELLCSSDPSRGQAEYNVIQAVLPIEMKCLQELKLCRIVNPASFSYIASVTSKLKSIKFSCAFPIPTSAIDSITRTNPRLEDVDIQECRAKEQARSIAESSFLIEDLVRIFSKCKKLRNIVVKFSTHRSPSEEILRQIVTPFRLKAVNFEFNFVGWVRFFSTGIGRCKFDSF